MAAQRLQPSSPGGGQPPGADARETALPAVRRRRRRTDWGRAFARVLCGVLALIGLVPFVVTVVLRSTWARTWAAHETERVLREQGILASYTLALHVWPLAVELDDVRIESSDGGDPALTCTKASVRPRIFALLAGKLAIDQVELDEPHVRAVVKDGQVANLALKRSNAPSSSPKWPTRTPFNGFALSDAALDLDIEGTRVAAKSLDLDVVTDQTESDVPAFEVSVRAGQASVHHERALPGGAEATDDDVLCSVEGRARIESTELLVRRFDGVGSVDLDAAPGTSPGCDLPADDKRRAELSLGHLHVTYPGPDTKIPPIDGHVRVRLPIGLAERLASLPELDGWIGLDADVRYAQDSILPDVSGNLEAHGVRLEQYSFASELHSQIEVRRNIVTSPTTTLRLGNGTVTLSDTVVDPLAKGARIEKTRIDVAGVDFTALLRDLGVHKSSWVGWDIREVHSTTIAGTIVPLKLDGEFNAKTYTFGVYDRPAEDKARERIFGVSEAQITSHLAIRPDALKFLDVHVAMPHSQIDGGSVSIGFHDDLGVDVPRLVADLDDVSPIGPVVLHGKVEASAHVGGVFNRPEPEGDIKSIAGLFVSDVSFGDLSGGHVKVDVKTPEVDFTAIHGKKGDSPYDVPTATLRFGKGFAVDAVGESPGFGLRDMLSMFSLDQDPRYDGIDARIATRANVHVALGGPEDVCGSGYIAVDAKKSHLTSVGIYGEHFAQGDVDVSLRWYDRMQGIAGADVDVQSFVFEKIQPPTGTRAGATGTVLGSASIRRGGDVMANVMIENVPLSRIDALGTFGRDVEGAVSGVAHLTGNLDDARPDAQLVAKAELDVGGVRVRDISFPPSRLEVGLTQRFPQQTRSVGRSRCGAPIAPPFDKAAYLADAASHGQWTVSGALLGGTVNLTDVVMTRARSPHLSGRVSVRGLDLGALARVQAARKVDSEEAVVRASSSDIGGQLWGEILADDVPLDDPARAHVRILLGPTVLSRGGQKLTLRPPSVPLLVADDTLSMPPLEVTLDTPEGFQGGFAVTGNVTKVTSDPTLALDARLEPVDLAVLQRFVPKVERATGKVQGSLRLTGPASSPTVAGELHATAEDIEVQGLPSAVTDVTVDVHASATELSAAGSAKFAGGTVALQGSMPVRGLEPGALDSRVTARGVRITPADGVSVGFDADLTIAYDPNGHGTEGANLPRVSGDVTVDSFAYTRPISLATDLTSLGARAKRTQVQSYDPSLDFVTFDVRVRSRAPLVVKNNLVEVQLSIDSGALEVTGTNQRLGLRGALQTLPGGRFHFQSSDFDVRQGLIRFEDPTRIAPNVDVTAITEYRRYTDTSAGAAAGAGTGAGTGPAAASVGSTRGGSLWRITLHAYGDADNLRVDLTSEPSLSQEDIVLLLAVGMTRAELDQLQASSIGASIALNYLGAASGASNAVKQALPVIDDFRFGSAYSTVTGKTEPQLTIGKRLTNDVRASVTAGLSEDRELRSNIEWRLNNRFSVQGSYDNINDVSSSTLGNLGVDLRWRLEFE
jgi:translocation and assembly module TamB